MYGKSKLQTVSTEDGIHSITSAEWNACINPGESVSWGYTAIYIGEAGYLRDIVDHWNGTLINVF